jgi:hypothetical protein
MESVVTRAVRMVLVAALVGLVVGGVAFVAADAPDPAAEARLALTTEVYWPYYDAVRQELQQAVESPDAQADMAAAAAAEADTALRSTEVRMPGNQSFLDVRVVASTEEGALAALRSGVEHILADDLEAVNREPLRRLAALDAEVAVLAEELEATPRDDPDRGTIELRTYQLLADADELRAAIASPAPRVAVLAAPALDDAGDVPARNAAIAGALGFLITLTLLRAFGRRLPRPARTP